MAEQSMSQPMRERIARRIDPRHWAAFDQSRAPGWDPLTKAMAEDHLLPSLETADAVLAEIETPTEGMAWRPIEEYHVGRDGYVVLTCNTPGSQRGFRLSYWDRTIERWRTVGSADWTHPSHFMPLPAPPAPQAASEKETERG